MATNRRKWGALLLLMLSALFAMTYLWRNSDRNREAASPVDQVVAANSTVNHPQSTSRVPAVVSRFKISADGTAAVPIQFQLAKVARVRTAPSFQEWLAQFPLHQQAQISAFNESHFGVYRVNSREQVAWMAENGYPMPEDIVAAEGLADRDLLKLANQGNDKAAFLLAERQNKELVSFLDEGGKRSAYFDGVEGRNRSNEHATIDRLVEQANSPYKGYLQASEAISGLYAGQPQEVTDAYVIAGLIWAGQLGDARAGAYADDYGGANPQRMTILGVASIVAINDRVDMTFMANHGGQHAGAFGRGIPNGDAPVY